MTHASPGDRRKTKLAQTSAGLRGMPQNSQTILRPGIPEVPRFELIRSSVPEALQANRRGYGTDLHAVVTADQQMLVAAG